MKGVPQLDKLVANKLKLDLYNTSAVSDILEGLTNGQIAGYQLKTYRHLIQANSKHWYIKDMLESEAIAHLFEALGSGGLRLQAVQEVFPTSWQAFLKYLEIRTLSCNN